MYKPYNVECKTVVVTEGCPTPTISYPSTPEIWFDGITAHCTITIDCGAGHTLSEFSIHGYDGSNWVLLDGPAIGVQNQTVDVAWEMTQSTDMCIVNASVRSDCSEWLNNVNTQWYSFVMPTTNIVVSAFDVSPQTCEAPCDVNVSATWINNGSVAGTIIPGYTVDGTEYLSNEVTLQPGESTSLVGTAAGLGAGTHTICPTPNP